MLELNVRGYRLIVGRGEIWVGWSLDWAHPPNSSAHWTPPQGISRWLPVAIETLDGPGLHWGQLLNCEPGWSNSLKSVQRGNSVCPLRADIHIEYALHRWMHREWSQLRNKSNKVEKVATFWQRGVRRLHLIFHNSSSFHTLLRKTAPRLLFCLEAELFVMHITTGYTLISNQTPLITLSDASLINGQSGLNYKQRTAKDTNRTGREFGVIAEFTRPKLLRILVYQYGKPTPPSFLNYSKTSAE